MDYYLGTILQFSGPFTVQGFLSCDGQTLSVSDFPALFKLIGTAYGGDGVSTFGLPKLNPDVDPLSIHQVRYQICVLGSPPPGGTT